MFKKIFCLIVGMIILNTYAQPTNEFIEHMRIANSALEDKNVSLACSSGKAALRNSAGLTQEQINGLAEMVNQVCQLANQQEATAKDKLEGINKKQR
jgi:hypothetical protein